MSNPTIELESRYCARNYHPLPVVLVRGKGAFVWDDQGNRYLDMMSAYSAVSHGHAHPRLVKKLIEQAGTLSIVSRAFHTDRLAPLLKKACELSGLDAALPMNTGAEAVETALKLARLWGTKVKGVEDGKQEIICFEENFHGRTISIISFSTDPDANTGFGPYTPGFKIVPYCPRCQTGGKVLADRVLSRLLKDDWPRTLEELEERLPARGAGR